MVRKADSLLQHYWIGINSQRWKKIILSLSEYLFITSIMVFVSRVNDRSRRKWEEFKGKNLCNYNIKLMITAKWNNKTWYLTDFQIQTNGLNW